MGPAGEDGLDLSQDARVRVTHLSGGTTLSHTFGEGRVGYVYLIDGQAQLDDDKLTTGDAAKIYGFHDLTVHALQPSELILIDVVEQFERVGVRAR